MNNPYLKAGLPIAACLILAGCVDDKYDLSDIGTTARIPVDNLTVPLNLAPIMIDDVIDISDNENIETVTLPSGEKAYAIKKEGTVTSDKVSIDPIHISSPHINDTHINLRGIPAPAEGGRRNATPFDHLKVKYSVSEAMSADVTLETYGIDKALLSIDAVESVSPIRLTIRFSLPQALADMTSKVCFSSVYMTLPRGLYNTDDTPADVTFAGNLSATAIYNPETGKMSISGEVGLQGNEIIMTLTAGKLNTKTAGVNIHNQSLVYATSVGLDKGGDITLTPNGNLQLPSDFDLYGHYGISDFNVANFSGSIAYDIEDIKIDPIDLSGLPDFLNDPETSIILANPQIYFGALNTTADYHTGMHGTLSLTSVFGNGDRRRAISPEFEIGWNRGPVRYNIALLDGQSDASLTGQYPNPTVYVFNGLRTILASEGTPDGLPKRIEVGLGNIQFYGNAVKFPVLHSTGSSQGSIDAMTGEYTFYAPLAFAAGSKIVYAKSETEIDSEDLAKFHVSSITLHSHAKTTLPVGARISLYLLDKQGRRMGRCDRSIELPPMSDQDISLVVTATDGYISGIDGIEYRAEIASEGNENPLSPSQTITLSDFKATVNGFYETDF